MGRSVIARVCVRSIAVVARYLPDTSGEVPSYGSYPIEAVNQSLVSRCTQRIATGKRGSAIEGGGTEGSVIDINTIHIGIHCIDVGTHHLRYVLGVYRSDAVQMRYVGIEHTHRSQRCETKQADGDDQHPNHHFNKRETELISQFVTFSLSIYIPLRACHINTTSVLNDAIVITVSRQLYPPGI